MVAQRILLGVPGKSWAVHHKMHYVIQKLGLIGFVVLAQYAFRHMRRVCGLNLNSFLLSWQI